MQQRTVMIQLPEYHAVMRLNGLHQAGQPRDKAVVITNRGKTMSPGATRYAHCRGHYHGHTALRTLGVVSLVSLGNQSIASTEIGA